MQQTGNKCWDAEKSKIERREKTFANLVAGNVSNYHHSEYIFNLFYTNIPYTLSTFSQLFLSHFKAHTLFYSDLLPVLAIRIAPIDWSVEKIIYRNRNKILKTLLFGVYLCLLLCSYLVSIMKCVTGALRGCCEWAQDKFTEREVKLISSGRSGGSGTSVSGTAFRMQTSSWKVQIQNH